MAPERVAHRRIVRIAVVYSGNPISRSVVHAVDTVRWLRVAEGLADCGFAVDLIADGPADLAGSRPTLKVVPWAQVDWARYDVVKTLFHRGFRRFVDAGGAGHPFVVSKLGSVVGPTDDMPGVHFFGEERRELWQIQQEIQRHARYVTVLTEPSRVLWETTVSRDVPTLLVPTGVDRCIPPPRVNPYPITAGKIAVYIGTLYGSNQHTINIRWQERLNALGRRLRARGLRLYVVGPGRTERLDPEVVTVVGAVPHDEVWDYQYFADVGLALAQGPVQHNESSKLYYYLRTGLPIVSEAPIPNNRVIEESGGGLTAPYGDDDALAQMVAAAAHQPWDRERAIRYVLTAHTWDHRISTYRDLLDAEFERAL
jgi:glycosyltransferase involved in cell wall biosynthesis